MGDEAPALTAEELIRLVAAASPHREPDAFLSGLVTAPRRMAERLERREAEYRAQIAAGAMGVVAVALRFPAFANFATEAQADGVIAAARAKAGIDNPFVTALMDRMAAAAAVTRLLRAGRITGAQAEALSFLLVVTRAEAPRPGTERELLALARAAQPAVLAAAPEVWSTIEAELTPLATRVARGEAQGAPAEPR